MLSPTGIAPLAEEYPERVYDVGIAEQHAVTSRGRPGDGRPAPGRRGLRDVPQPGLRPGAAGRGAAPAAGDVRAGPGRHHRRRRAEPQRHVGHVGLRRRARPADRRARATPRRCARSCARRSPSTTARPSCASRRARSARDLPARRPGRRPIDVLRRSTARDVLLVAVGALAATWAGGRRSGWPAQGYGVTVVDPRWVSPVARELVELAAGTAGGDRRGQRPRRRRRVDGRPGAARRRTSTCRCATSASRSGSSTTPSAPLLAEIGLTGRTSPGRSSRSSPSTTGDALNEPAGGRPGSA